MCRGPLRGQRPTTTLENLSAYPGEGVLQWCWAARRGARGRYREVVASTARSHWCAAKAVFEEAARLGAPIDVSALLGEGIDVDPRAATSRPLEADEARSVRVNTPMPSRGGTTLARATATIRLDSTQDERDGLAERRVLALRAPPTDPRFWKIFGIRETAENDLRARQERSTERANSQRNRSTREP